MKNTSEKLLLALICVLTVLAAGLIILVSLFHIVDFKLYRKNLEVLDLRGEEISIYHYDKLVQRMPDCEILWDIPFQGQIFPADTREVTVSSLTEEDALTLYYMKQLQTVHAEGCRDYALLQGLQQLMPDTEILYTVAVGGEEFPQDSQHIAVRSATEEEIRTLPYLTELKKVTLQAAEAPVDLSQLRNYCLNMGLELTVELGSTQVPYSSESATVSKIQEQDLYLLAYLPHLTQLHLKQPQIAPSSISELQQAYPNMEITWDVNLFGQTIQNTDVPEDLDLSKTKISSLEELEHALSYLDGIKTVFLGEPGFENADIDAYRDRVRDQYKVIWEVRFGKSKPFRTDATFFFPARDGYAFRDGVSDNIRYCEDLITIDVGHLGVSDVSWLAELPNLEYLILAHTGVQYIDGIENCKKLKFLELDWSGIRDLTPLKGCTALEDLNIGRTNPDITPLLDMPWLKNIYMIFGNGGDAWTLSQALPNTRVVASGTATVSSGWRRLPNYYAMRDSMGAHYMN